MNRQNSPEHTSKPTVSSENGAVKAIVDVVDGFLEGRVEHDSLVAELQQAIRKEERSRLFDVEI